ncbi:hypothetical protein C0216_12950 [Streptomyces globosus]|uniref:Uncharacterized protein n=1 Tax=Streptomyces globosus TaxID=68209 RepID=A0A344U021_9ACTN|nr:MULTISPECIES: hypothetical protein [Streptomyces]AXE24242.1 hypothetical protein C0216_12950 [Streptomyces globosus]
MNHRTSGRAANPLRRRADRTRFRLHAAFVLACLIAVFCGAAAGWTAWTDSSRAAEAVARHRHAVTATTVGGTSYRAEDGPSGRTLTVAPATWNYPPDRTHRHTVSVPAETRTGDTVRVWVDDRGNPAAAPPGTPEVVFEAFGLGTLALTGILLVSGALVRVGLRIVDVRASRAWESEWESVEPVWSGRLRPGQGADDG